MAYDDICDGQLFTRSVVFNSQLLRDKKNKNNKNYQLKSVPNLNKKQQTDLVNNCPSQISS
jgi:hypothetical protein